MAHRSRPSPRRRSGHRDRDGLQFVAALPAGAFRRQFSRESRSARRRRSAPTPAGLRMGSGCISPPIPGSGVHTWRQRFPDGKPEQVTFGVTEEEGIHVAPDGRSFVTSIGTSQSTLWVHDSRGDRQITSEGYSYWPSISPDSKKLYYLVRTGGTESFIKGGLWVTNLETGQRQRLLPDFQMQRYNISPDGQRVVFTAVDENGHTPGLAGLSEWPDPAAQAHRNGLLGGLLRRPGRGGIRGRGEENAIHLSHKRRRQRITENY